MTHRRPTLLLIALAVVTLVPAHAAQTESSTEMPRTPWGTPDLQGVWDFRSLTPMERPDDLSESEVFTAEEAAQFAAETIRQRSRDNDTSDRVVPYNDFWFDEGTSVTTDRTSLIVDPPDGRVPPMTQAAIAKKEEMEEARRSTSDHEPTPGGFVEDLGPGGAAGPVHLGIQLGPTDGPERLQQQRPSVPDGRHRRPVRGNEP